MRTQHSRRFAALIGAAVSLSAHPSSAEQNGVTAEQAVSALERRFGVHSGQRRNHIKGTCASGEFVGSPQVQRYSRSSLFTGERIPVVARFSLAGGNPDASDAARAPRGMALEFRLSSGAIHHMTMLNTPVFGVNSPQGFIDDLAAKAPNPATGTPDPQQLNAFKLAHPENAAQAQFLAQQDPGVTWTSSSYFGIHTFKFIDLEDETTFVRWRFVPRDGPRIESDAPKQAARNNFLEAALIDRVGRGPVVWDMVLTIGEPGDPQNDATKAWPKDRTEIKAGTLTIMSASPQQGAACERINFDPLVMTDGIAPTDDPVLLFRSSAYAISFGKRLSESRSQP